MNQNEASMAEYGDVNLGGENTGTSSIRSCTGEPKATQENRTACVPESSMLTLALDLGTRTGWALMQGSTIVESGTWVLAIENELLEQRMLGEERSCDFRFSQLADLLQSMADRGVKRVVFEDVIFATNQAPAQLWPTLRAAIWAIARTASLRVSCVPVATLKKFATGNGGAKKEQMAQCLAESNPALYVRDEHGHVRMNGRIVDDNEVDAIWIARFTAAVDRGEKQFLGPYQRKIAAAAARRERRSVVKAERKARKLAQESEARAKRMAFLAAIKNAGRCCGVFRKPASRSRAMCPKCGRIIKISLKMKSPSGAEVELRSNGTEIGPAVP